MRTKLIRMGNSQGIRIPEPIIEQCGFAQEVEMSVEDGKVILAPAKAVRAGWDGAFRTADSGGETALHFPDDMRHEWDEAEWEW